MKEIYYLNMTVVYKKNQPPLKEIGGFLELELNQGDEFHPAALKLNSGRNALRYFISRNSYRKIYLPVYLCDSVILAIQQQKLNFDFYSLNNSLEPQLPKSPESGDILLYVNYFGINQSNVRKVSRAYKNVVIDNCQAFFDPQADCLATFYSPRKFFGVPDGGYLYADIDSFANSGRDQSYDRCLHLLKRVDINASESYCDYKDAELGFRDLPIRKMSNLTEKLIYSIDYSLVKSCRMKNFAFLHNQLIEYNGLKIDDSQIYSPLAYPFLCKEEGMREYLNDNKIYVPRYWQEVLSRAAANSFEEDLTRFLLPLPIDQRYDLNDMQYMIDLIKKFIELNFKAKFIKAGKEILYESS